MQIRCPHCRNPIEIVSEETLREIACPSCGSSFSLVPDDETGTRLPGKTTRVSHFEFLERLGIGAFGSVWKALDTELDRLVAVKIPRNQQLSSREAEAFLREARAAAQLNHPHIVRIHEVGRDDDTYFIVSDLVEGVTLSSWLTARTPTFDDSVRLCRQVADALYHAHQAGVIHRDLKPSNIMIDMDEQPLLLDFGLAKRQAGEMTMTIDGQVLGTPAYMSPEQARGEAHRSDARSDIYSLGVVLYELLAGELPFRGDAKMLLHQVLNDEPPSPRTLNGRIPRDLETITLKCLAKDPGRRYQDAAALSADLGRFLEDKPILARPVGRVERAFLWCRRNPRVAGLSTALLALFICGFVAVSLQWRRAEKERAMAVDARERANQEAIRATEQFSFMYDLLRHPNPEKAGQTMTVVELLDHASSQLATRFKHRPEFQVQLLRALAESYRGLGEPYKAVLQYNMAIEILSETESNPKLLVDLHIKAANLMGGAAALEHYRVAAEVCARHLPADSVLAAIVAGEEKVNRLGAGTLLERADNFMPLAAVLLKKTVPEVKIQFREGILELRRLASIGRGEEAQQLVETTLSPLRKIPGFPKKLNEAAILVSQYALDDADFFVAAPIAEWAHVNAIEITPGSIQAIDAQMNFGHILTFMGNYEQAETLLVEAVEESHNAFTDQHRVSILALDNLCFLRLQQGQGEEALGLARHAHKAWIELYGPYVTTPLAHRLSLNIAQAVHLQGNLVEARSELNKVIVQGAENKFTRSTQYIARVTLARLDLQAGQLQAALDGLQQAMGNIEKINELEHWTRTRRGTTRLIYLQSLLLRGQVQTALQQTDAAEADLVQSYRGFEKMFGEGHPSTGEALDLLKQLYRETRQFEKLGHLE